MQAPYQIWNKGHADAVEIYGMSEEIERAAYGLVPGESLCDFSFYTPESVAKFKQWCENNGFHYYARTSENFFVWEAVDEARAAGKRKVIVDNLS